MIIHETFSKLLSGKNLSEKESRAVFHDLFTGKIDSLKAKSLLLLLAKKGETAEEVTGCLKALRELEPPYKFSASRLMDTCGTGGDGSHSINVSTLAAIVIAGAGGKVAKHGNRGLTSQCGSSDLLEACGINLEASSKTITKSIQRNGIGYFHAPYHHPTFSQMQPIRRSIKTRTIFNLLGPLCNPVRPKFQLVGVGRDKDFKLFPEVLKNLGVEALVCQSQDGLDEISISAPTQIAQVKGGKIKVFTVSPEQFGFKTAKKSALKGGNAQKNKQIALKVLSGKLHGPVRDIVLFNAGAGLWISGKSKNLEEGILEAAESIDSGKALKALEGMKKASRS